MTELPCSWIRASGRHLPPSAWRAAAVLPPPSRRPSAAGKPPRMEAALARLAPDLRYLLDSEGVPQAIQQLLSDAGYVSVRLFSMVDTEARGVKDFCRAELALDPTASAAARLNVAKVMAVWMTATARIRAHNEQDSTANTSNRRSCRSPSTWP